MSRRSAIRSSRGAACALALALLLCTFGGGAGAGGEQGQRAAEAPPDRRYDPAWIQNLVDVRPVPPAQPWVVVDAPFGPATLFPTVVVWPWWQPLGHEIIPYGPNGYVYRPTYPAPEPEEVSRPPRGPPVAAPHRDAATLMQRAVSAARAGHYAAALAAVDQLVAQDPADGYAHLLRSFVLLLLDDYAAASDALHRALWTLPREEWGAVASNWQDYVPEPAVFHRALACLERFVRQQPLRPEGHFLLGYHYGYLGRHREAVDQLAEALELYQLDGVAPELLEFFRHVRPADQGAREF